MGQGPRRTFRSIMLAALVAFAAPAGAQEGYPSKPIHIVVPSNAGGTTDIVARALAQAMEQSWGASFVIEQKPGGSTNIGMSYVAHAAPDGYTLLVVTDTLTSSAAVRRDPGYDPVASFEPITILAKIPTAIAVRRDLGVTTMDEFVALARKRGKDLTMASTGTGTVSHLTGLMFRQRMDLPAWTDVPYAGSAKAITDLLGGHVDAIVSTLPPLVPHAERGDIRIIAVTTRERARVAPGVPSIAEVTNLKDFDVANWTAFLAPAGTPAPIVSRLVAESTRAVKDPEVVKRFDTIGLEPVGDGAQALASEIGRTLAQWREVVRRSGLTLN